MVSISSFNPRPRMGGDAFDHRDSVRYAVSIHAPAWGATIDHNILKQAIRSFNPRPRMGGDVEALSQISIEAGFNPRPRMGGDLVFNMSKNGN